MTEAVKPPLIQKNFITKEECETLLVFFEKSHFEFTALEPGRTEANIDRLSLPTIDYLVPIIKRVQKEVISHFGGEPSEHHLDFGVISKMLPGSYVSYHADNVKQAGYSWIPNHTAWRTYSACLYLTECHGGGLRFPYRKVEARIEPGTLVGFPSTKEYFHGTEPVIAGIRMGIILWFTQSEIYDMWKRLGVENLKKEEILNADRT